MLTNIRTWPTKAQEGDIGGKELSFFTFVYNKDDARNAPDLTQQKAARGHHQSTCCDHFMKSNVKNW